MTYFPQPNPQRRAARLHLRGSIQAIVLQEDGHHAKAKLQTVSTTGGLLRLAKALSKGDFVEVAFKTDTGSVRGMAEMLSPFGAIEGTLQPFRFIAMDDDDHRSLRMMVDSSIDKSFIGLRSSQWSETGRH